MLIVFCALKYLLKLAVFPLVESVVVIKVIKVINLSVYKSTRVPTDRGYNIH